LKCSAKIGEQRVISAFESPYFGSESIQALEAHLGQCTHLLNIVAEDASQYLPYISIVQSSGTGKTRLVFEFAEQKQIPLFYMCLRKPGELGYPFGSASYLRFLAACQIDAAPFIKSLIEQIGSLSDYEKSFFFRSDIKDGINISSQQTDSSLFEAFWLSVFKNATKFTSNATSVKSESPNFLLHKEFKLQHLVVIDEARALLASPLGGELTFFVHLRRAIVSLKVELKNAGILIVFIDTSSKVADFSPPVVKMTSAWRNMGFRVLPTFHNVANPANLFWRKFPNTIIDDSNVLLFGRPLWWSSHTSNSNFKVVLTEAKSKLLCSPADPLAVKPRETVEAASAAIVCCLLDLTLTPGTQLTVELISSHMVCLCVSECVCLEFF
jgi:hypothetical protein